MKNLVYVAVLICVAGAGCSDNAVKLRHGIEAAAERLDSRRNLTEERVSYMPVAAPAKGYWLIFFPERRVYADELVTRGVPRDLADRIFSELGYVDVGLGASLVVAQEGERLTFTSYHGRSVVRVRDLIVEFRVGRSEVLLKKHDETLYIEGVL